MRVENCLAKRVPGSMSFMVIFRDNFGEVIAIPEDEVARFRQLAIAEGFDKASFDDYAYLPQPQQAVGNTAKAIITIEHQDKLSFWINEPWGYFITWDDEHPALDVTINGEPIPYYLVGSAHPPSSPQPISITIVAPTP